jgi:hypothetical protein
MDEGLDQKDDNKQVMKELKDMMILKTEIIEKKLRKDEKGFADMDEQTKQLQLLKEDKIKAEEQDQLANQMALVPVDQHELDRSNM